jgi:hypothetical protein
MPGVFGLDLDKPVLGTDEIGKLARATNPTADQPSQPLNGADHPVCRSNGVHTPLAPDWSIKVFGAAGKENRPQAMGRRPK